MDHKNNVLNNPVWYNPFTLNFPIFCQDRHSKGVLFIADLFYEGSVISVEELNSTLRILIFWIIIA